MTVPTTVPVVVPPTVPPTVPTGYRLVTPAAWDRVDLTRAHRADTVARLVARQFRGLDDQPAARARATRLLQTEVERAHGIGGLELHLSVLPVLGTVVPASVLVHVLPGGWAPAELARLLAVPGAEVGVRDLPAGQAVRRVRRHALSAGEDRLPVVAVEHFVPVPGVAPTFLVVSGHTLEGPLEAAVVELFDTVVATLRWTGGTP